MTSKTPPLVEQSLLRRLMNKLPEQGRVEWIGVRESRRGPVIEVDSVTAVKGSGLQGDRYNGGSGKRGVTLIQAEHLPVIAAMLHIDAVDPASLRRNIVVSGINLLALKDRRFRLGEAVLEYTGQCHPCSRMEEVFGEGGYNAVRGHGGITARVVDGGLIRRQDTLCVEDAG